MNPWFRELGPGMVNGQIGGTGRIYFMMDFSKAAPGTQVFLTGVAYNDNVTADQFYTPGEGLGGHRVEAWQGAVKIAEAPTWASGGYRLPLAAGTYQVRIVDPAGGVSDMGSAVIASENVKLDSRDPVFTAPPANAVNLRIARLNATTVSVQWDDPAYTLFASGSLTGPWELAAGASPATITIQPGGRRFFRGQR
jgi:hypothetical protein